MKRITLSTCLWALPCALAFGPVRTAAQITPATNSTTSAEPATEPKHEEPMVLSPFTVDTSKDKGYKATNATSGTRLNTAIKDAPLPIEVITNDFMRDVGATNLRQALQYSSGILLTSQNDALMDPQQGLDKQPGSSGANSPQSATANNNQSTFKLRGFVVDQTLRDGFRRQFASDWINIDRVEVVRGPEALLYGVGSFGGVINYEPKRPQTTDHAYAGFGVGTQGYLRSEIDVTGPLGTSSWQPAYRVTAAWQQNGDYTQWYHNNQFFISPVLIFHPTTNTEILIDNEFGHQRQNGNGFQGIRDNVSNGGVSGAVARGGTFITGGQVNSRTFRWSGPDPFLETPSSNSVIKITQKITPDFFIQAGADYSHVENKALSIPSTNLVTNQFDSSNPLHFDSSGNFLGNKLYGTVPTISIGNLFLQSLTAAPLPIPTDKTVVRYYWQKSDEFENRIQYRAEANYQKDLGFWGKHSLLTGVQYQYATTNQINWAPPRTYKNHNYDVTQSYSFKNPNDLGPFRYGIQGDGRPDPAMIKEDQTHSWNWDLGYYTAYQGKFWSDRVTVIGGVRWDRDDARGDIYAHDQGVYTLTDRSASQSKAPTAWSPQVGLSYAVTKHLSVFGLYSTGLIPNYNQLDGNGQAKPTTANNKEVGVKFDLWGGRISGTVSAYQIERKNTPRYIWWAPAPYKSASNPLVAGAPQATVWQWMGPEGIWYAMQNYAGGVQAGLAEAKKIFPSGYWGALDAMAKTPASASNKYYPDSNNANWTAGGDNSPNNWWGLDSTAASHTGVAGDKSNLYFPLVNLNDPAQFNFANGVFTWASKEQSNNNWPGQFYGFNNGQVLKYGDGTTGVQNTPNWNGAYVPINDQSKGWDTQIVFTPTDNLQLIVTYARVNRKITSPYYQYVNAPYFPFAQWYYPQYGWGTLNGGSAASAYTDPTNSSTNHVQIAEYGQSEDDSPKDQFAFWSHYRFDDIERLKGLGVGFGGTWSGPRQWYSGFNTDGTTITVTNPAGTPVLVQMWTKPQWVFNALVDYNTKLSNKYNLRVALNLNNILDDQKKYGYVYGTGFSMKLTTGISF